MFVSVMLCANTRRERSSRVEGRGRAREGDRRHRTVRKQRESIRTREMNKREMIQEGKINEREQR